MPTTSKIRKRDDLTLKQRKLLSELEQIASLLRVDFGNIKKYQRDDRTTRLRLMTRHLIIGEVVMQYTLINEYLDMRLCDYFFSRNRNTTTLWRTKKFRNYNYYILETLSLIEKLRFVKAITKVPKRFVADIERINALRNGLAHTLFPENLRAAKLIYKGKDIFTLEGIRLFVEDMSRLFCYFHGIKEPKAETNKAPVSAR